MKEYRRFDDEFKSDVVDYTMKHPEETKAAIAASFGIAEPTLYKWLQTAKGTDGKHSSSNISLNSEIKRLKKENALLQEKNEILVRASAYIAEHLRPKGATPQ